MTEPEPSPRRLPSTTAPTIETVTTVPMSGGEMTVRDLRAIVDRLPEDGEVRMVVSGGYDQRDPTVVTMKVTHRS